MLRTGIIALLITLGSLSVSSAADEDLVKASLLADTAAIQPGQPFRVGVLLKIAPHWHLYWKNPGDGGIPTLVELKLPEGFSASAIQYPVPRRLDLEGGLLAYGYEDEVMLMATITPPAKLDSPPVNIAADASWLVCEKSCVMGKATMSASLPVGDARPKEPETFAKWTGRLPGPVDRSVIKAVTWSQLPGYGNESNLVLTVQWSGDAPADVQWFPPASESVIFGKPTVQTEGTTSTITAGVTRLAGQKPVSGAMESVLSFKSSSGVVGYAVPVKLGNEVSGGK
jgi:thiol:disulfide interchange protein DsbD